MSTEYPYTLPLGQGLRQKSSERRAEAGMVELSNLKPTPSGYERLPTLTESITDEALVILFGDGDPVWPFPQLVKDEGIVLLCNATELYTVDISDWSTTAITIYQAGATGTEFEIDSGGAWQLAALDNMWFLTNGVNLIWSSPSNTGSKVLGIKTTLTVQSLAVYDDRLFLGGLGGTYWTNAAWTSTLFPAWKSSQEDEVLAYSGQTVNGTWLMWSEKLGGDIEWPLAAFLGMLNLPDATTVAKVTEALHTQLNKKVIGLLPLRNSGNVLQLRKLGNSLITYTKDGVYEISGKTEGYNATRIIDIGGSSRICATGDRFKHLYVGADSAMRSISQEGIALLDYREFLADMTSVNITSCFDSDLRDYYFSDGAHGFIVNDSGLSRADHFPTSIVDSSEGTVGIVNSTIGAFSLITNTEDLGSRGLKEVGFVEIQSVGITSLAVAIDYRYDRGGNFITSNWVSGSPFGEFYLGHSGVEFRIRIRGTMSSEAKLEKVVAKIMYTDSRAVGGPRGIGLPATEGQA